MDRPCKKNRVDDFIAKFPLWNLSYGKRIYNVLIKGNCQHAELFGDRERIIKTTSWHFKIVRPDQRELFSLKLAPEFGREFYNELLKSQPTPTLTELWIYIDSTESKTGLDLTGQDWSRTKQDAVRTGLVKPGRQNQIERGIILDGTRTISDEIAFPQLRALLSLYQTAVSKESEKAVQVPSWEEKQT